jgi:hypothetical protein
MYARRMQFLEFQKAMGSLQERLSSMLVGNLALCAKICHACLRAKRVCYGWMRQLQWAWQLLMRMHASLFKGQFVQRA